MTEALNSFPKRIEWYLDNVLVPLLRREPDLRRATKSGVAERIGISKGTLSAWRRGKTDPDDATLDRVVSWAGRPRWEAAWIKNGGEPAPQPVNLDDALDPRTRNHRVAGSDLEQPTPDRGTFILGSVVKPSGRTAREFFEQLVLQVLARRQRGEQISDLENAIAAAWTPLEKEIAAAEVQLNEADGTRTRNHRIDSVIDFDEVRLQRSSPGAEAA